MYQFYPGTVLLSRTVEKEEFRLPIVLTVSSQPLYVKIVIPSSFPVQKPIFQAMARVIHSDLHPVMKTYEGKALKEWGPHSNLLSVLRSMQAEFEKSPPMPEHLAPARTSDVHIQGRVSNDLASGSGVSTGANFDQLPFAQPEVEQAPVERSDAEKQAAVDQIIASRGFGDFEKFGTRFFETLKALNLTELERLKNDLDYRNDSVLSAAPYKKTCQMKDSV